MHYLYRSFFLALTCIVTLATTASAQQYALIAPDVTLSAGYSNLQTERATHLFYTHDGSYLDLDFAWRLPTIIPLQAGIALTGSGNEDRHSIDFTDTADNFDFTRHLYSDLGLFEIEPRLAMRIGGPTGFYLLPRLGAGLLIDSYAIDQASTDSSGYTYLSTDHHTGAAVEIRPALQFGYSWGHVSTGIEASYMAAWGDFGGFGHNAQELRGGLFLNLRW